MKAIVYSKYGSPQVLHLKDVDKPTPGDDEVLVKVQTASINAADYLMLRGLIPRAMGFGVFHPRDKILGADIAGRVTAVGKNVKRLTPGDSVYGDLADSGYGGLAEYVCASESLLALIPENVSFEAAAAVPLAAVTAWRALIDEAQIQSGQRVAVNGASGGVGSYAVLLAKVFGTEVTAICSSRNQEMAQAMGADHVLDYTQVDFTRTGNTYDIIVAANGYHPLKRYREALQSDGTLVVTGGSLKQIIAVSLKGPAWSRRSGQSFSSVSSKPDRKILESIGELLAEGQVKPVIDKVYSFSETAEAFRYVMDDHPQGKVVIRISDELEAVA